MNEFEKAAQDVIKTYEEPRVWSMDAFRGIGLLEYWQ